MDSSSSPVGIIAVGRPAGASAVDGDVKSHLHGYLQRVHEALLWKLDGLGERDARWPMTPTGTNLLGLLKHVVTVESEYFGSVFDRDFPEDLTWTADDAEDNDDMWAWPEETIGSVRALAERVWAHVDATIEDLGLDAPGRVPWWGENGEVTLGDVLVHVLAEVARHAGQADILREMVDGTAGLSARHRNLPGRDAQWWADYVRKLEKVAAEAADA